LKTSPGRQYQYPTRFGPLDIRETTHEVWREPPPVRRRRRLPVAALPCIFFVDAVVAPAAVDAGEWQFKAPQIRGKAPTRGESVFYPPHIDAAPVGTGAEWAYQAPYQPPRRQPQQPSSEVEPGHVEPGLLEPPQPDVQSLWRRQPQHPPSVLFVPEVEPGIIDFIFQPAAQLRRRQPEHPPAVTQAPEVEPGIIDWLAQPAPHFPRRSIRVTGGIFAPAIDVPPPDTGEWQFFQPVVRKARAYRLYRSQPDATVYPPFVAFVPPANPNDGLSPFTRPIFYPRPQPEQPPSAIPDAAVISTVGIKVLRMKRIPMFRPSMQRPGAPNRIDG